MKPTNAKNRNSSRLPRIARLTVLFLFIGTASTLAAPADIFESPGNISSGEGASGVGLGGGKAHSRTGAFTYSVPISVPPGRLGASPSIALNYSSEGSLYGGIAAGWSLGLPVISRDYSDGQYADVRWVSSMAGRELVPVSEPSPANFLSYRAASDTSGARYQKGIFTWRVLRTDGSVLEFGESSNMQNSGFADWFPLTKSIDAFGNEVNYFWEPVYFDTGSANELVDLRISRIEYSANPAASLTAHAIVEFEYSSRITCGSPYNTPVGAAASFRSGSRRIRGIDPLASVKTKVANESGGFRDVRRYDLGYDLSSEDCSRTDDAPSRQLQSVDVHAWSPSGVETSLPPITFGYGEASVSTTARTSPAWRWWLQRSSNAVG